MYSAAYANPLAYLSLLLFVPLCFYVFRRFRPPVAAFGLILGAAMFLPQRIAFDLPGLPVLGKEPISYLGVLAAALYLAPRRLRRQGPGTTVPEWLVMAMLVGGAATVFTNMDPLRYGPRHVPGMQPFELVSACITDALTYGLPFFLGRCFFRDSKDLRDMMTLLALAGLVYTLGILVELRMSPQLHHWAYGFHPNTMAKANRWGGYRPMMFMPSGIAVGIFMATAVIAAAALARAGMPVVTLPRRLFTITGRLAAPYLTVLLVLCKSVAAMVWGVIAYPLLLLSPVRTLAAVAVAGCVLVTFYPPIRLAELFPWRGIVEFSAGFSEDRAKSLNYRFENEERMLAKARERFVFGWGGYSRNWVYDPETGIPPSVPDGYWIIQLGSRGMVGFICAFGLYVLPVVLGFRSLGRIRSRRDRALMAGLMLIVIVRALDQLPNGFYSSYPIFMSGALYSLAHRLPKQARRPRNRAGGNSRDAGPAPDEVAEPRPNGFTAPPPETPIRPLR
ncbi:MAG: hypothetical protein MJE66_19485 [Proteobacteria bacterium]|nr:hypothetical protein [Pseudomonadota bacterium]